MGQKTASSDLVMGTILKNLLASGTFEGGWEPHSIERHVRTGVMRPILASLKWHPMTVRPNSQGYGLQWFMVHDGLLLLYLHQ